MEESRVVFCFSTSHMSRNGGEKEKRRHECKLAKGCKLATKLLFCCRSCSQTASAALEQLETWEVAAESALVSKPAMTRLTQARKG